MTDSNKLDLILTKLDKLDSIENRVGSLESKFDSLEGRVISLESKFDSLEGRVISLEGRVISLEENTNSLRRDFNSFKHQVIESIDDLKAMDAMILDEVERVHTILNTHTTDKSMHTA